MSSQADWLYLSINVATVIFFAGMVYSKLNAVIKTVEHIDASKVDIQVYTTERDNVRATIGTHEHRIFRLEDSRVK
jgi:hypothetical protein